MKIRYISIACIVMLLLSSCVSKKEILYLQDIDNYNGREITYQEITIQPNDILNINVGALIPETAVPYNRSYTTQGSTNSIDLLKLEGYLVTKENTILFPALGIVSVDGKTTTQLEKEIKKRLKDEGHLVDPSVSVRILNAKVTILGEVNNPGTYNFTEESITVLQALGYAGDITIQGVREDVLIMREVDGFRQVTHVDLTSANWLDSPNYFIKPNDVIIVNQNNPKVKSAGFINNLGALLGTASFIITVTLLLTR